MNSDEKGDTASGSGFLLFRPHTLSVSLSLSTPNASLQTLKVVDKTIGMGTPMPASKYLTTNRRPGSLAIEDQGNGPRWFIQGAYEM